MRTRCLASLVVWWWWWYDVLYEMMHLCVFMQQIIVKCRVFCGKILCINGALGIGNSFFFLFRLWFYFNWIKFVLMNIVLKYVVWMCVLCFIFVVYYLFYLTFSIVMFLLPIMLIYFGLWYCIMFNRSTQHRPRILDRRKEPVPVEFSTFAVISGTRIIFLANLRFWLLFLMRSFWISIKHNLVE